jgi:hypothetical protein
MGNCLGIAAKGKEAFSLERKQAMPSRADRYKQADVDEGEGRMEQKKAEAPVVAKKEFSWDKKRKNFNLEDY